MSFMSRNWSSSTKKTAGSGHFWTRRCSSKELPATPAFTAAAVIVADKDLTNYTPLMRGSKGSITGTITQFEFPVLESLGLLKIDFLGLSTLTVMREACRLIKEHHGIDYSLDSIPIEGPQAEPAFRLLSSGEVSGVFQVESQGMRRVLTEMKPTAFEHIIATISLYRPGPMEYIPNYIKRMHGEEEMEVKHPSLEPVLAETYGIIVYQEQIIQILNQLAGYSPAEADLVRQAISKKDASKIEYHKSPVHRWLRQKRHLCQRGTSHLRRHRILRPLWLQQGARSRLCGHHRADRLSEGVISGRIYGCASTRRAGQDRKSN